VECGASVTRLISFIDRRLVLEDLSLSLSLSLSLCLRAVAAAAAAAAAAAINVIRISSSSRRSAPCRRLALIERKRSTTKYQLVHVDVSTQCTHTHAYTQPRPHTRRTARYTQRQTIHVLWLLLLISSSSSSSSSWCPVRSDVDDHGLPKLLGLACISVIRLATSIFPKSLQTLSRYCHSLSFSSTNVPSIFTVGHKFSTPCLLITCPRNPSCLDRITFVNSLLVPNLSSADIKILNFGLLLQLSTLLILRT